LRDTADALRDAQATFSRFDPTLSRLRGDEPQALERLQKELRHAQTTTESCRQELAARAASVLQRVLD
jgi:hypothetical protein